MEFIRLAIDILSRGLVRKHFFWFLPLFLLALILAKNAEARFASRFSLSATEEYNDNIFFTKEKDQDFVTSITPTLTFLYAPPGQKDFPFRASIGSALQVFARNSDQNNFGDNTFIDAGYTYRYSPRLSFEINETLRRIGETRTQGSDIAQLGTGGDQLSNRFSVDGTFLYTPKITFTGGFAGSYQSFLDEGGTDIDNSVGIRGTYQWEQHNLHAGYRIRIIKSRNENRNDDDNILHDFDLGDDYFSSKKIKLTPTLTLSASSGISLNTGGDGPAIANNTNINLIKVWRGATFTAGVSRGLTSSLGVSGLSNTTRFLTNIKIQFTRFLTATADINFSLFDTDDEDFDVLQAQADIQYLITGWLSSNLRYIHRRRSIRTINSNSVLLFFTAHFDIWPNPGLGKAIP